MRVIEVSVRRFRGFEELRLQPRDHIALVGEPRSGRSDLIEGLRRVLASDATRYVSASELDFFMLDTDQRAEVEVVLGDLGQELEQDFVDYLEAWDSDEKGLAPQRPPTQALIIDATAWVLRLCYRIEWDDEQEMAAHWVDFPADSDPTAGSYARVPRRLHDRLPVVVVESHGRPLRLGARSDFRRLIESGDDGTLASALDSLVDAIADAGETLAGTGAIKSAVADVLKPVEGPLGIDASDDGLIQFVPEGGSLSGVLRTLQPALDLGGPGHLPLHRHGTTAAALLQAGEAIASLGDNHAVVLVDDFGEDLDPISARHVAALIRKRASQAWISTRRSSIVEAFPPSEIVRLHYKNGKRRAAQIDTPTTKAERVAARHLSVQLLPAASAAVVAVVEGPHDRAALDALAVRRFRCGGTPLPAAGGISIVDAGVIDGSGGSSAVARLARLATALGFHTIAVIDGDRGTDGKQALESAEDSADAVVRLPDGSEIERALIEGLDEAVVRSTLQGVCDAFDIAAPSGLETQSGSALLKSVVAVLKKNGGLHAQFVELLPTNELPPVLKATLEAIVALGTGRGEGTTQL